MEIVKTTAAYARIRVEASGEYAISGTVTINNEGTVMPMADTRTGAIGNGIVMDANGKQVASFNLTGEKDYAYNIASNDIDETKLVVTEIQKFCDMVRENILELDVVAKSKEGQA